MRKAINITAAVAVIATGVGVMQLKLAVQEKREAIEMLAHQIQTDRESIRVMEAEWAYLTTPAVLQDMSIDFLALMPSKASQFITDPTVIPMRPKGLEAEDDPGVLLENAFQQKPGPRTDKRHEKEDIGL